MIQPSNEATNLLASSVVVFDDDDSHSTNTTTNSACSRQGNKKSVSIVSIRALPVIFVGFAALTLLYTVAINNSNSNSNGVVIRESYQSILDIDIDDTDTDLSINNGQPDESDAIMVALYGAANLDQSDKELFSYLANFFDDQEAELKANAENGVYELSPLPEPDTRVNNLMSSTVQQANNILQNQFQKQPIDARKFLEAWRPRQLPPPGAVNQIDYECTEHIISFVGSVVGIIMQVLGVSGVGNKAYREIAGKIIAHGTSAIDDIVDVVKNSDLSPVQKILKASCVIYDLIGLGEIFKAITGQWTVWDYILNGSSLLAQLAAIVLTDGAELWIKLLQFFRLQLQIWALARSIVGLVTNCAFVDVNIPDGTCHDPKTGKEDPTNRFCEGSTQYIKEIDFCYKDNDSDAYCWSPIQAQPVGNFQLVSEPPIQDDNGPTCDRMCYNQGNGVFSPKMDNCYQSNINPKLYFYFEKDSPNPNCDDPDPNLKCRIVPQPLWFACGDYYKYAIRDQHFCGNAEGQENFGECRDPNQCCTIDENRDLYRCDDPKQEVIGAEDTAVTTLPKCPQLPSPKCISCQDGSLCCDSVTSGWSLQCCPSSF